MPQVEPQPQGGGQGESEQKNHGELGWGHGQGSAVPKCRLHTHRLGKIMAQNKMADPGVSREFRHL